MVDHGPSRIDQCLFGYADGHRLLATSLRLSTELASDLTAASDIAPGVRFSGSDGYWTGIPIPALSRYGLMRTWPAPEMPRPGCVWTHLLLFDPALFETVADLSCFKAFVRRPVGTEEPAEYSRPLTFVPSNASVVLETASDQDRERVAEILGVLYAGLEGPVETKGPGELDGLVMAVWSQQWPRLRRNFRFQTAATTGTESANKRFDLQLRIARPPLRSFVGLSRRDSIWLELASNDLEISSDHQLRAFLRRYGQDVKRQRGSFRPLTEVFAILVQGADGKDLPALISRWFPDRDDAASLKRDLMDGVIFADNQIESVLYLCEVDKGRSLPAPSEFGLGKLAGKWNVRSFDLMRLAEWAAIEEGDLADMLLSTVAKVIPAAEFWNATEEFPEMRRRMVANQPELLDAEPVGSLKTRTLLSLIDAVPPGHDVGAALVRRLPIYVDRDIVIKALERFPVGVLSEAIQKANTSGLDASKSWLGGIHSAPSAILNPDVMVKIKRLSVIVAIAEELDWLSQDVIQCGLEPWMAGLANAKNDVEQWDRDSLECFLFALAITVGGPLSQAVFEWSFGYIHDRIFNSYLHWQAQRMLESRLPSLGWTRDWDKALKLRLAVTQAYVQSDLDPHSFGKLLGDKRERKMLRRAAEEVDGADRFAHALRD